MPKKKEEIELEIDQDLFKAVIQNVLDQSECLMKTVEFQREVIDELFCEVALAGEIIESITDCESGESPHYEQIVNLKKALATAEYVAGLRKFPVRGQKK